MVAMMVLMMVSVMLMLIKANSDLEQSSHSAGDRVGCGEDTTELLRIEYMTLGTPSKGMLRVAAHRFTHPSQCPASAPWSVWTRVPSSYHMSCRW